jgi:hypothetical protein
MPNPYDSSLEGMFNVYGKWNPLAYMKGADMLDKSGQYNDQQMQELSLRNKQTQEDMPEQLRRSRLMNDEREAGLPGIWAQSNQAVDKAALSRATIDDQFKALQKEFASKASQQDLEELRRAGEAFASVGERIGYVPGPIQQQEAKRLLGRYWLPEFEQYSPGDLQDTLRNMGRSIMDVQPKLYGDLTKQNDKQAFLAAENEKKLAAQKELAAFRASLSERLAKLKQSQDPKTYEAAATQLRLAASREADNARREILAAEAADFEQKAVALKEAAARVKQEGQLDVPAVTGLPGLGGPRGNNPVVTDPNLAKLPPGTKALGNGIYMLPDGRKIKANK